MLVWHGVCWWSRFQKAIRDMIAKESLRLGQSVLYGESRVKSVVEMLAQTFAVLSVPGEGEVITGYGDVYGCVQGQA